MKSLQNLKIAGNLVSPDVINALGSLPRLYTLQLGNLRSLFNEDVVTHLTPGQLSYGSKFPTLKELTVLTLYGSLRVLLEAYLPLNANQCCLLEKLTIYLYDMIPSKGGKSLKISFRFPGLKLCRSSVRMVSMNQSQR
jgi:hypothetical protein